MQHAFQVCFFNTFLFCNCNLINYFKLSLNDAVQPLCDKLITGKDTGEVTPNIFELWSWLMTMSSRVFCGINAGTWGAGADDTRHFVLV